MDTAISSTPTRIVQVQRSSPIRSYLRQHWPLYVMMLPAVVLLLLFSYYPMYGVVMAFQKFNPGLGFANSPWLGLANFERLFSAPNFGQIMANTFIIAISKLITLQSAAILLALLLNEVRWIFYRRFLQSILYLPYFLSWIVLGGIVLEMLGENGLVNQALKSFGGEPIIFLSSNAWFRLVLIVSNLWKGVGWSAIIYLAALNGIDPHLYEAAVVDGANRWQQTWNISLPGILPVIVVVLVLNLGFFLQADFEQVFTLYNLSVLQTGDILGTYVYRQGITSSNFGLAAAAGLMGSVISLVLIVCSYWAARRWSNFRFF